MTSRSPWRRALWPFVWPIIGIIWLFIGLVSGTTLLVRAITAFFEELSRVLDSTTPDVKELPVKVPDRDEGLRSKRIEFLGNNEPDWEEIRREALEEALNDDDDEEVRDPDSEDQTGCWEGDFDDHDMNDDSIDDRLDEEDVLEEDEYDNNDDAFDEDYVDEEDE